MDMTYQPIENYGMIGDMHTVALVGTDGSIDWLCVPRFDSPSVFAAILDDGKGGRFKIAPVGDDVTCKQFYWPETNVLITRFLGPHGAAETHRLHARGPGSLRRQAPSPTHTTRHRGHAAAAAPSNVMNSRRFTARCLPCSRPKGWHTSPRQTASWAERDDRESAAENFFQGGSPKQGHPISPPGPPHRQKSFLTKFPGMAPG